MYASICIYANMYVCRYIRCTLGFFMMLWYFYHVSMIMYACIYYKIRSIQLEIIIFTSIALPDEWQFQKILSCKFCGQWMFVLRTATDRKMNVS